MKDCSVIEIPTIQNQSIKLTHIDIICPVCEFEIDVTMEVDNNRSIRCEMCDHIIKFKIVQI